MKSGSRGVQENPELYKELGRRLREARTTRQLILIDVRAFTGIHISHLSRIERGLAGPTVRDLLLLATTYEIPVQDVLTDLPL